MGLGEFLHDTDQVVKHEKMEPTSSYTDTDEFLHDPFFCSSDH